MSAPTASPTVRRQRIATEQRFNTTGEPIAPKDVKPPRSDNTSDKTDKPSVPSDKPGKIAQWMTRLYRRVGVGLQMVDPQCGMALFNSAEAAGLAWERLAKENKTVRDIIYKMMQTTAFSDLFLAHLPILIAVAIHHVPAVRKLVQASSAQFMREFMNVNIDDIVDESVS